MRFDILPSRAKASELFVDLQTELLDDLTTRVVAPLVRRRPDMRLIARLHPVFRFRDQEHVLLTHAIVAVPRSRLGEPVGSLAEEHDAISHALDKLFLGF